jgi:hypothetical protein
MDDYFEVATGNSPRSNVDDFRRVHPEIELDVTEPLPDRPMITTPGGGAQAFNDAQAPDPVYDEPPSFDQPSETFDQAEAGDFA